MAGFDFEALTRMWVDDVERGVARLAEAARGETFYALAFHGGYAERGRRIDGPIVGANSEEGFAEMHPGGDEDGGGGEGFDGVRWSPADWKYEELELGGGANAQTYRALSALGREGTLAEWDQLEAGHDDAIVAAAQALAQRAQAGQGGFAHLRRAKDFVVFVHDPSRAGPALARRSIPAAVFERLFPEQAARAAARSALARQSVAEQVRYAISRFGVFTPPMTSEEAVARLVELGAAAVPALIAAMAAPEHGGTAAMTLAKIGAPAAEPAVAALRSHLERNSDASRWAAIALARLGRLDELAALAAPAGGARRRSGDGDDDSGDDDDDRRDLAIRGLAAGRPDSYPHLAALLERRDSGLTTMVANALRPGSAAYAPSPAALPVLAAVAASPHAILRRDVACALSKDALESVAPRCAALLAGMLRDGDVEVRRLAALNLGFIGRAARTHVEALRALLEDPEPKVAEAARHALGALTPRG